MSTRQYIGARYVPKFYDGSNGNQWDPGVAYEALTIVTFLNNSYTSKISVPAGVGNPADNPLYWVNTGNYNSQVEAYRQDVLNLSEVVTSNYGEFETYKELNDTNINDIDSSLSLLTKERYVVISDSYGLGRNNTTAWTSLLKQYLNISDDDYFTYSEGSMGFVNVGDNQHTALTLLQSKYNDISSPDTITKIVVGLGANDIGKSDISTAILSFNAWCTNNFKNAKIYIGFIGNTYNANISNYMRALFDYNSANINGGYISGVENIMHDLTLMQTDLVHPTSAGSNAIALYIHNYLMTGSASYSNYTNALIFSNDAISGSYNCCISKDVTSLALTFNATTADILVDTSLTNIVTINNSNTYFRPSKPAFLGNILVNNNYMSCYLYNATLYFTTRSKFTIPSGTVISPVCYSCPTVLC